MALPSAKRTDHGRVDFITLLLLTAIGAFLTQLSPDSRLAITDQLRGTVLLPVLETHRFLSDRVLLQDRLSRVQAERDSLARALATHYAVVAQNHDMRVLLELGGSRGDEYEVADLEGGLARSGESHSFLVRVGSSSGVVPPTGVLSAEGLLGVLRTTREEVSMGEFWTHPDFRVSVRTADGEATGIVRPSHERDQPIMLMEGAPFQTEIPEGTPLYTSGVSGIYPPGLRVGTVRSMADVESGWERSYSVEPAVRPEETDIVLVWRRDVPSSAAADNAP